MHVAAGGYAESVAANKPVTLLGANHGVSGCGTRGAESAINGNAGLAIDIQSDGVTVDGFAFAGGIGLRDIGASIGQSHKTTRLPAGAVGVELQSIAPTALAGVTVQSNCIVLTSQLAVDTPTIGMGVLGVAGTVSPVLLGNSINGAFYGYLLYALDAAQPTLIKGGSITGVMQGVAVVNFNPQTLAGYLPSAFVVDSVAMSGFTGNYSTIAGADQYNFHAGVYVYTGGTSSGRPRSAALSPTSSLPARAKSALTLPVCILPTFRLHPA